MTIHGKLDWNRGSMFEYKGKEYFNVPFIIDKYPAFIQNNNHVITKLSLVFRKSANGFIEAAIKEISKGDKLFKDQKGNFLSGEFQNYTSLSGEKSTLWIKTSGEFRKAKWLAREDVTGTDQTGESNRALNCYYITSTYWVFVDSHGGYDNIVVDAYQETSYALVCETTGDVPPDSNDWPNGGGGGNGDSGEGPDVDDTEEPNNDQCFYDWVTEWNKLIGATVTSGEAEFTVSTIGPLKKYKNPRWKILKNLTWDLYSQETGIVKLVDAGTDKWVWESLQHGAISMTGFALGGTVSSDQGVGIPSFFPGAENILYAGMTLDFNVKFSPICDCPGIREILPPYTIHYTSNSGLWPAKP